MSSSLAKPAVCRAGCAQEVITPKLGISMAGYFHDRIAKSVRDDLYAKAVVIEHDGRRIALVSCDLISIDGQTESPSCRFILLPSSESGICRPAPLPS